MTYTMEDIMRDNVRHALPLLSPQDFEDIIQSLPPEKVIQTFSTETLLQHLPQLDDMIQSLPPEKVIKTLSPQDITRVFPIQDLLQTLPPQDMTALLETRALLQGQRDSILSILHDRFSPTPEEVQVLESRLSTITRKESLRHLLLQAIQIGTLGEFLLELNTIENNTNP